MLIRRKWWFERKIHIILRRQKWQPVVFTVIPRRQNDDQQCEYYRSYRHVLALLAESVKTMISSSFSYVGVGCIRDEVGPEVNEERIASLKVTSTTKQYFLRMCHLRHRSRIFLFDKKIMFRSWDIQVFSILKHPMFYQICDVMMSTWDMVHFWIYLLNHNSLTDQTWSTDTCKQG